MKSEQESQRDYRDRLYSRYVSEHLQASPDEIRGWVERGFPYLESVVRRFFPAEREMPILDLGCGYGSLLYTLQKAGYRQLSGVETSPEQVRAAHLLGLQCVRQGDIFDHLKQAPDRSQGVVIVFDVLEHFRKDEVLDLLDHIHRVLRDDGMLLLHVPNGEGIFGARIFFSDFTHQAAYTPRSVRQVLSACGFDAIACYEDEPVAHSAASFLRRIAWKVIRTCYRAIHAVETGDPGSELVLTQNLLAVARKRPS